MHPETKPEPVEDFDNGYDTELTGWGWPQFTLDWRDRANMRVLTTRDMMRRYSAPSRLEELATRANPFMRRIRFDGKVETLVGGYCGAAPIPEFLRCPLN